MENELISKKDLLQLTGVSYGQLYRWKRKNLIPEDWFIHKSTFTGQETFFPKAAILARIDKIINMKDDLSLDQLADMFSPMPAEVTMPRNSLIERNIVSKVSMNMFNEYYSGDQPLGFDDLLIVYMLEQLLQTGEISLDEGRTLVHSCKTHNEKLSGSLGELIIVRKMGVSFLLLTSAANEIYLEPGAKIAVRVSIAACIEQLKTLILSGGDSHEQQ